MKADIVDLQRALRNVMAVSKKEEAEIVNHTSRDIAYRAMQFTAFASPAQISSDLKKGNLLVGLAVQSLKKKQGKFTKAQLKEEMRKINARKRSGSKALRAGWIPAVLKYGGTIRGGAKLKSRGSAAKGTATKATIDNLSATIINEVQTSNWRGSKLSADQIKEAQEGLRKAVRFVTEDRQAYARRKLNAMLRKYSD